MHGTSQDIVSDVTRNDPHGFHFRKRHQWYFMPKSTLLAQGWCHQRRKESELRYLTFGECIYAHSGNPRGWHTAKYHGGTIVESAKVVDTLSEQWNLGSIPDIITASLFWPLPIKVVTESHCEVVDVIRQNALLLFEMQALLPDRAYDAYLASQHHRPRVSAL